MQVPRGVIITRPKRQMQLFIGRCLWEYQSGEYRSTTNMERRDACRQMIRARPGPRDGHSRLSVCGIRWADVPREATAGITLAALIIPLNIGFAQVAGLPPAVGLYSAIVPLVIVALLTTSPCRGQPGCLDRGAGGSRPVSLRRAGDPLRLQYAGALALMCGLLFFVFWFFRLAFLANFLSRAVLVGFISGLGIEVFTNQVRKILGASVEEGSQVVAAAASDQGSRGQFDGYRGLLR